MKTLVVVSLVVSLIGCAPRRPKTNTTAPSLGTARVHASQLGQDIHDYKGGTRRLRTLSEQIDYKASLIE